MLKQILIIFIILFASSPAFANVFEHPQKLSNIIPNLPEFNNIKCKFEQEKTIPQSNIILKSSGNFEFEKEKGIVFKTTFPIQSETSYNTDGYKQINDIISAISNKNYGKIEAVFDFYFEQNGKRWTLGLVPKKSKQPSKYIKSMKLKVKKIFQQ